MASTSTVYKSQGACTDTSLPIQFKDPAATSSTIAVFDALDTTSYQPQAAPTASDTWKNLMSGGDATFSATRPGWSNGFTFDGTQSQSINGPTTMKLASNAMKGFFFSVWVKFGTVAAGNSHVAGLSDGTVSTAQYGIYRTGSIIVFWTNGTAAPQYSTAAANTVYQLAVGYQGDNAGNFVRSSWINGVLIGSGTVTASSIVVPTSTQPLLGRNSSIGNFNGTMYRAMFDDLTSGATVASLVAADYAAGVGRFS